MHLQSYKHSDRTDNNEEDNGTDGSDSDESMRKTKRTRNGKKYKRIIPVSDSESESSSANPILTCVSSKCIVCTEHIILSKFSKNRCCPYVYVRMSVYTN